MNEIIDSLGLNYGFMQRALIAGIVLGAIASYYGVFVVQRGLGFLGSGLAHAAFGGIAIGVFLAAEPLWIAVPFTVVVSVLITFVRHRTRLRSDTIIGIFFALSMALGIVLLSRSPNYNQDAMKYLFGSILAVGWWELCALGGVAVMTLIILPLWGRWSYTTFDREMAQADRVSVGLDDYVLAALIGVTIVVSVKVVGIVLASAFLVVPAATGRLLAGRFITMTVASVVVGMATAVGGVISSYWLDFPSGATIVLLQGALFFAVLCFSAFFLARRRRVAPERRQG